MCDPKEGLRQRPKRSVVPYFPHLLELIEGKKQWQHGPEAAPLPPESKDWNQRGYLPHRDEPGLTQFVTFRLADAFPVALRAEWESLLRIEDRPARLRKLEGYLDKGRGASHLRQPQVAALVESALRLFHGTRYELRAWVIMPNHVHVMFIQGQQPLGQVVGGWKSYTAREANRWLRRTGSFWEEDYWDTYMRNGQHERRTRHYIERNPVKARLVREACRWPWSSARFRDAYGRLVLPKCSPPTDRGPA